MCDTIRRHPRSVDGRVTTNTLHFFVIFPGTGSCLYQISIFFPFTLIERTCSLYHSAFNHSSAINKIFCVDSFQLMKFLRSKFCDRGTNCRNQLLGAESCLQGSILIKPVMNISQWKIPYICGSEWLMRVKTFSWDTVVLMSIHCAWYFLWHGHLTCQSEGNSWVI